MKTFYENPEMEVVTFESKDIISTSGEGSSALDEILQTEDTFNGAGIF